MDGRALSDRSQTKMCLREKAGEMEISGGPGMNGRVKLRDLSRGQMVRGVGWVRGAPSGPGALTCCHACATGASLRSQHGVWQRG